jgi:predicted enzyme related to lactoylglutathione lyase
MLAGAMVATMIPASALDRARGFYEGTLGLSPTQELADGVMYTCAKGSSFMIYPSQFAGTAQNTAMGWQVDDLEAEMAELRSRGVVFEEYDYPSMKTVNGVYEVPGTSIKSAWFKDSEGNILALTQM